MNQSFNTRQLTTVLITVAGIVFLYLVYTIITSIVLKQATSPVHINTSDTEAVITISQTDTEAAQVGIGSTSIRLKPGSYFVMANTAGKSATKTILVTEDNETDISLALSTQNNATKTAQSLTYTGFDAFVDNGLSTEQVNNIKKLFYTSNKDIKNVTVTESSVQPGARDPESINFPLTFSGTVDGIPYTASLLYSGLDYVQLTLKDSSRKTAFTGELPSAATGD